MLIKGMRGLLRWVAIVLLASGLASCGGDDGDDGVLAVAPTIAAQPAAVTVSVTQSATFTVSAEGTAPLQYQWLRNGVAISDAIGTSYTLASASLVDDGAEFSVTVSNGAGQVSSQSARLTVTALPPSNVVGPAGGTLSFLGGALTMVFAPGSVAAPTAIDVQRGTAVGLRYPAALADTSFVFGPAGSSFAQPVRVTVRFDAARLPAGTLPETLQIAKATDDGWSALPSTVDAAAGTVSAELSSFSSYAIVPGLQAMGYGAVPGMAVRYFDWPMVRGVNVATDTTGGVFITGSNVVPSGDTPVPAVRGGFMARLNTQLSVQWLRELPGHTDSSEAYVAVDPQGNAFALYNVGPEPADPFFQIRLMGFNPNGTVRSGFPVSIKVATGRAISALQLSVDALGNIHVFGAASNLSNFGIRQGSYTVVRGSDGTLAAATREFSLGAPVDATSVNGWDMGLDFAGNVYFSATWFSNGTPGFGGKVLSFSATALGPRPGFPKDLTGATFIGSRVNSVANTPMLLVPVLGGPAYPFETQLSAYNAISGDMQPGFPVTFTDVAGVSRSVADIAGNVWVLGQNTPAGAVAGRRKTWVGSVNESGQMRAGFPRVFGGAIDTSDVPDGITADATGTVYVTGTQDQPNDSTGALRRIFVMRMPGL
jgi:hypothetical protein